MLKRDELYLAQLTNISWEGRISTCLLYTSDAADD